MNKGRRLLKFKYGSSGEGDFKKCFIKYETERTDGTYDLFTFECDDEPHPDLKKKLEDMADYLLENCEIAAENCHRINVKSVTSTYKQMEGFEVHGLVISGTRELKYCNAPMCITSPHKTDRPYCEDADDDGKLLSSECLRAFEELEEEAFAYVDGKRAQLELGLETPDPSWSPLVEAAKTFVESNKALGFKTTVGKESNTIILTKVSAGAR